MSRDVLSGVLYTQGIGCTPRTLSNYESGRTKPSEKLLEAIVGILEPPDFTHWLLRGLIAGSELQGRQTAEYLAEWNRQSEDHPHPKCLVDEQWSILAVNTPFVRLHRTVTGHADGLRPEVGGNAIRFFLFHPQAREMYRNWERDWLMVMLAYFARAYHARGEHVHPELVSIMKDVARYPEVAETYEKTKDLLLADMRLLRPEARSYALVHPDRPHRETGVHVEVMVPASYPDWCSLTMRLDPPL